MLSGILVVVILLMAAMISSYKKVPPNQAMTARCE